MDDRELLERFIQARAEEAFEELVRRHVDLVYGAARRQARDAGEAEDVTQMTFLLLAQKAGTIRAGEAVAGWLLAATRHVAMNMRRAAARRAMREREAAVMKQGESGEAGAGWEKIGPVLDEAMSRLNRGDRDVVTLRYLEGKSLEEVARSLGVSERAAQKRVWRAVGKLRGIFARVGIRTSAEALTASMGSAALLRSPAEMAGQVSRAVLAAGPGSGSVLATKGAMILMATKTKLAIGAVVVALVGFSVPVVYVALTGGGTPAPSGGAVVATAPAVGPATGGAEEAESEQVRAFEARYALKAGEVVKRIMPADEKGRDAFAAEHLTAREMMVVQNDGQVPGAAWVFAWDGKKLSWKSTSGPPGLSVAMRNVTDVWPSETDIPLSYLEGRWVSGDWVVRADATEEEKMKAFFEVVGASGMPGAGKKLVKEEMEREVIVVSGKFGYRPMAELPVPGGFFSEKVLHVFRGDGQDQSFASWPIADSRTLLRQIGEQMNWPMVMEADMKGAEDFNLLVHRSAIFSKRPAEAGEVDEVLANLKRQTGLEMKRERRKVMVWRMVEK